MASLLILVPISLILLGVAAWAFVWAVRGGQYDNLDAPAIDILRNDPVDADTFGVCDSTQPHDDAD